MLPVGPAISTRELNAYIPYKELHTICGLNWANSCLIKTGEDPAAPPCPLENIVCAGAGLLTMPGVPANIVALVRLCMAEADTI